MCVTRDTTRKRDFDTRILLWWCSGVDRRLYMLLQLKSRTPGCRANGEHRYMAGKSSEPETGDARHSRFHFLCHRAHPELAYSFVVQLCSSVTLWCNVMWCCCVFFFRYSDAFLNCPLGINEVNWIELNWTKLNIYTLIRHLIRGPDTSNLIQYSCHWVGFTLAASKPNHEMKTWTINSLFCTWKMFPMVSSEFCNKRQMAKPFKKLSTAVNDRAFCDDIPPWITTTLVSCHAGFCPDDMQTQKHSKIHKVGFQVFQMVFF